MDGRSAGMAVSSAAAKSLVGGGSVGVVALDGFPPRRRRGFLVMASSQVTCFSGIGRLGGAEGGGTGGIEATLRDGAGSTAGTTLISGAVGVSVVVELVGGIIVVGNGGAISDGSPVRTSAKFLSAATWDGGSLLKDASGVGFLSASAMSAIPAAMRSAEVASGIVIRLDGNHESVSQMHSWRVAQIQTL